MLDNDWGDFIMEAPARSGPSIVKPSWWHSECLMPLAREQVPSAFVICCKRRRPQKMQVQAIFDWPAKRLLSLSLCLSSLGANIWHDLWTNYICNSTAKSLQLCVEAFATELTNFCFATMKNCCVLLTATEMLKFWHNPLKCMQLLS